jgi:hypothetical protein
MKQLIEWYALALGKPVMNKGDFIGEFEDGNITAGDQGEESHD